jgi:RimJ/RimL family protein N-acetyltransferase
MTEIHLAAWSPEAFAILRGLNVPEAMVFLGGPESEETLLDRQQRYMAYKTMYQIVSDDGEPVGNVGYWEREWDGEPVYETGYGILPKYWKRGLATAALRLIAEKAAREGDRRWLHAFPEVEHTASNGVARKAGFELLGPVDFEYPKGHWSPSNNWRLDLNGLRAGTGGAANGPGGSAG